jgi:hypothetical protein
MAATLSPGRIVLGVLLIAAGAISGIAFLVVSLVGIFSALLRVEAPGSGDVRLERGSYTVYWEIPGAVAARGARGPEVDLSVQPADGGAPIAVDSHLRWTAHYSTGSRVGVLIAAFQIDRADLYRVSVRPPPGSRLPKGTVALTPALGLVGTLKLVLVPLALVAAGVGCGLVVLLKRPSAPATPA